MFRLDLEKAEEPEIKLPTSVGSQKKQESSRKTSTFASLTVLKSLTVWITTNCGKFLRDENTGPSHLPPEKPVRISKRNRTRHRTLDWFQIGKGVRQGCILSPCLFNFYSEYIMQNAELDEAQVRIKIAERNISNLRYADDTTLMEECEEELKSPLMKEKEEKEKLS